VQWQSHVLETAAVGWVPRCISSLARAGRPVAVVPCLASRDGDLAASQTIAHLSLQLTIVLLLPGTFGSPKIQGTLRPSLTPSTPPRIRPKP
jgi:hypothetical protein